MPFFVLSQIDNRQNIKYTLEKAPGKGYIPYTDTAGRQEYVPLSILQQDTIDIIGDGDSYGVGTPSNWGDTLTDDRSFVFDHCDDQWEVANLGNNSNMPCWRRESHNNVFYQTAKLIRQENPNAVIRIVCPATGGLNINSWINGAQWDKVVDVVERSGIKEFDMWLWHHGANDALQGKNDEYYEKWYQVRDSMLGRGYITPSTPTVLGALVHEVRQGDDAMIEFNNEVLPLFRRDSFTWVSTAYIGLQEINAQDNLHFKGFQVDTVAQQFYNTLKSLPYNYDPLPPQKLRRSNDTIYLDNGGGFITLDSFQNTDDQVIDYLNFNVSNKKLSISLENDNEPPKEVDLTDVFSFEIEDDNQIANQIHNNDTYILEGAGGIETQNSSGKTTISLNQSVLNNGIPIAVDETIVDTLTYTNPINFMEDDGSIEIQTEHDAGYRAVLFNVNWDANPDPNTDNQLLTRIDDTLFLEDGGSVILPSGSIQPQTFPDNLVPFGSDDTLKTDPNFKYNENHFSVGGVPSLKGKINVLNTDYAQSFSGFNIKNGISINNRINSLMNHGNNLSYGLIMQMHNDGTFDGGTAGGLLGGALLDVGFNSSSSGAINEIRPLEVRLRRKGGTYTNVTRLLIQDDGSSTITNDNFALRTETDGTVFHKESVGIGENARTPSAKLHVDGDIIIEDVTEANVLDDILVSDVASKRIYYRDLETFPFFSGEYDSLLNAPNLSLFVINSTFLDSLAAIRGDITIPIWKLNGNDAYYEGGFVGIEVDTPSTELHIGGPSAQITLGEVGPGLGGPHGINFIDHNNDSFGIHLWYRTGANDFSIEKLDGTKLLNALHDDQKVWVSQLQINESTVNNSATHFYVEGNDAVERREYSSLPFFSGDYNDLSNLPNLTTYVTQSTLDDSTTALRNDFPTFINTDTQSLSFVSPNLTISRGNTVDLSPLDTKLSEAEVDAYVANNGYLTAEVDGSVTNEIQALSKSVDSIKLSDGGFVILQDDDPTNELYDDQELRDSIAAHRTEIDNISINPTVSDNDWTVSGNYVYNNSDSIGIGTTSPSDLLQLSDVSNPAIRLQDASQAGSYARLINEGNDELQLNMYSTGANGAFVEINPIPDNISQTAGVRFFEKSITTGNRVINVFRGNGTNDIQHKINADGDSYMQRFSGGMTFGSNASPSTTVDIDGDLRIRTIDNDNTLTSFLVETANGTIKNRSYSSFDFFSGDYTDLDFTGTDGLSDGVDNVDDADNVIGNEFQDLSIIGNTLSISDGNSVTLPNTELNTADMAFLSLTHSTADNINSSATNNLLSWNTHVTNLFPTIYSHSTSSNPSRIPVEESGNYQFSGSIEFDAKTASVQRYAGSLKFRINGSTVLDNRFTGSYLRDASAQDESGIKFSIIIPLEEDDYVELLIDRESSLTGPVHIKENESTLDVLLLKTASVDIAGDGWGADTVAHDNTLTGKGTAADPLSAVNDGDWIVSNNYVYNIGDSVGINVANPDAPLHIKDDQNPAIRIQDGTQPSSYSEISEEGNDELLFVKQSSGANGAFMEFDPLPGNSSQTSGIRFFPGVNTSGSRVVNFFRGDGSTDIQHKINVSGDSYFHRYSGGLTIGSNATPITKLFVDGDFGINTVALDNSLDHILVRSGNGTIKYRTLSSLGIFSGKYTDLDFTGTTGLSDGVDDDTQDLSFNSSSDVLSLDNGGSVDLSPVALTQEEVQDFIGGMVSGNTETGINVLYDDPGNEFDFVVDPAAWSDITGKPTGFADNVDNVNDPDASPTNELQTLSVVGSDLTISSGNTVTLPAGSDNQTLSFDGTDEITISGGNTIDISGVDNVLTQEQVQDFIGSMVSGNTETNISVTYDDVGNEFDFIVSLIWAAITGMPAGFADGIDNVNDPDASPTNELQDLSYNATTNILTLSDGGGAIDISEVDTDDQILIWNSSTNQLTISGGNTVTLNPGGSDDHDWYEIGGTTPPNSINDNKYSLGKLSIGSSSSTQNAKLNISTSANEPGIELSQTGSGSNQNTIKFEGITDWYFGRIGANNNLKIGYGSTPSELLIMSANNRVGINVTPNAVLHLNREFSSAPADLRIDNFTSATANKTYSLFNVENNINNGLIHQIDWRYQTDSFPAHPSGTQTLSKDAVTFDMRRPYYDSTHVEFVIEVGEYKEATTFSPYGGYGGERMRFLSNGGLRLTEYGNSSDHPYQDNVGARDDHFDDVEGVLHVNKDGDVIPQHTLQLYDDAIKSTNTNSYTLIEGETYVELTSTAGVPILQLPADEDIWKGKIVIVKVVNDSEINLSPESGTTIDGRGTTLNYSGTADGIALTLIMNASGDWKIVGEFKGI